MNDDPKSLVVRGVPMLLGPDGKALIEDEELAKLLKYEDASDIRELTARLEKDGKLPNVSYSRESREIGIGPKRANRRIVHFKKYRYTRRQALKLVIHSRAPGSDDAHEFIIDVFFAAEETAKARHRDEEFTAAHMIRLLLVENEPEDWVLTFEGELVEELCRVYRRPWTDRRRQPRWLAAVFKKVYRYLLGDRVFRELQHKAKEQADRDEDDGHSRFRRRLHQYLNATTGAAKAFRRQLDTVRSIARQSDPNPKVRTKRNHKHDATDFWCRMRREFQGAALQLRMEMQVPSDQAAE